MTKSKKSKQIKKPEKYEKCLDPGIYFKINKKTGTSQSNLGNIIEHQKKSWSPEQRAGFSNLNRAIDLVENVYTTE